MSQLVDIRDVETIHKTLLCIKDTETEFGLFCAGAHAMLLSLLKKFIPKQEVYRLDIRRDLNRFCGVADNLFDWFDTAKRNEAIDAEILEANHRIGEQVLSIVRKVREEDGRKVWEKEDGGE